MLRGRGHGAFGIEQVFMIWSQAQFDQGTSIGDSLCLPSILGLVADHGFLGSLVPDAGSVALHVVLADQSFLDFTSAFWIDFLLPAPPTGLARSFALARSLMSRGG